MNESNGVWVTRSRAAHLPLGDESIDVSTVVSRLDAVPNSNPHAVDGFQCMCHLSVFRFLLPSS